LAAIVVPFVVIVRGTTLVSGTRFSTHQMSAIERGDGKLKSK
jgi:hypothetical protein